MTTEELQVIISAEIKDLKQGVENATKDIKKFSKDGESNMKKFGDTVKAVSKGVGTAMKAVGAAILAGAAAIVTLSESTEEYRRNQAKLNTAFESAGASAEQATETYNDLYRVLGDDDVAVEAAGHLAKLTTNQEDLAEWTDICQGVYATFGDSLPIEGLTEAANETAKVGTLTGSLADALNWAGVNEEEFQAKLDACNTEAEREALIRGTLNGLYQEAAAGYEENAAEILAANEAQAALNASLGALGEAVTPLVTLFKEFGASLLSDLVPGLTQVADGLKGIFSGTEGAAEEFKAGFSSVIESLISKLTEALPQFIEIGIQLVSSLIEGIVDALPDLIEGVSELITELAEALPDIWQVIVDALPNVITSIVEKLPELIPAIVDGLVQAVLILMESIPTIIQPIIDALPSVVMSLVSALLENLPLLIEGIVGLLTSLIQMLPQLVPVLLDLVVQIITLIAEQLPVIIPMLLDAIVILIGEIISALPDILSALIEALPDILKAVWDAIVAVFEGLIDWFGDLFSGANDAIKEAWSGVADWFGGVWDGICGVFSAVGSWFSDIFSSAWNGIVSIWSKASSWFSSIWNSIKNVFAAVGSWFGDIFKKAWNGIKNAFSSVGSFFTGIWDSIKSIFSKAGEVIGGAIKNTVSKAVNAVLSVAVGIINGFISAINFAIDLINLIPGVEIGKLSKLDVPQMAKGGVVDSATLALIGERGKEAVVPLENNLEWLDKMANMLSERIGGTTNAPIVLQVDGKTFAQISVDSINQLTRQRGSLALNLV